MKFRHFYVYPIDTPSKHVVHRYFGGASKRFHFFSKESIAPGQESRQRESTLLRAEAGVQTLSVGPALVRESGFCLVEVASWAGLTEDAALR
jgi:hypothetical protein